MKRKISQSKLRWLVTVAIVELFLNCSASSPTRPNPPYNGPFPESFNFLAQKNPLLMKELFKLPELQDGISPSEEKALVKLAEIYFKESAAFDAAFEKMYRVGKPGVRKYCSPLQAVFWLTEDDKLSGRNDLWVNYSLDLLLNLAWNVAYCEPNLTDEEVLNVIAGIEDQKFWNQFQHYIKDGIDKTTVNTIFGNYACNPKMFSQPAQKIILKALRTKKTLDPRWIDFETVVERLNSPELVDFYQKRNFRAFKYGSYGENGGPSSAPEKIFIRKGGNCDAFTAFTIYCLKRAGYEAWPEVLKDKRHITTLFKSKDGIFILDNAWYFSKPTGLLGPFSDRKAALSTF